MLIVVFNLKIVKVLGIATVLLLFAKPQVGSFPVVANFRLQLGSSTLLLPHVHRNSTVAEISKNVQKLWKVFYYFKYILVKYVSIRQKLSQKWQKPVF